MATFLGQQAIALEDLKRGHIAFLGAPEATPYVAGRSSHSSDAPRAIRDASQRYANWGNHFDFDLGATFDETVGERLVDVGDVDGDAARPDENRAAITKAVSGILERRAIPLVIGGDDAVPIPVLAAYGLSDPLWIVQIDAHIDWRKSRFAESLGWSSTMRRASEMAWVKGIVQIGIRGVGSAFAEDVADARAWGAKLVTARTIHESGIAAAIDAIPAGANVFVSMDCDGLDPGIMPAVMAPAPGGLTYGHILALLERLSQRQTLAGMALVELAPERDIDRVGALTATRVLVNAAAAMCRTQSPS